MAEYVDFHYMPLEGKITGKQVLKQTEDAINDLGEKVYSLDIDSSLIDEAIETSEAAMNIAESALSAVTTGRSIWFNNVSDMIGSASEIGVVAETKGYYLVNDGGGAVYIIRQKAGGDVVDGGSIIQLADEDMVAQLVTDGEVNVKQFGAKGNGVDDDSTAFQNTSTYAQANGFTAFVALGTYNVTETITGTFNSFGEVTIVGGGTVDIVNLHDVVDDVTAIKEEVESDTTSAQASATSAATSATNAASSATSASTTLSQLIAYLDTKEEITAPIVDPTLTISGAAADAKVTGDKITYISNEVRSIPTSITLSIDSNETTYNYYYIKKGTRISFVGGVDISSSRLSFYFTDGTNIKSIQLRTGLNYRATKDIRAFTIYNGTASTITYTLTIYNDEPLLPITNFYNKATKISGYIDGSTIRSGYYHSDFIPIALGDKIIFNGYPSTFGTVRAFFYDANQTYKGRIGATLRADGLYEINVGLGTIGSNWTIGDVYYVAFNMSVNGSETASFYINNVPEINLAYGQYQPITEMFFNKQQTEYISNSGNVPIAGKKIAYNGDSICESRLTTGNTYNGGAYAHMIANIVGGTYSNRGHGGGTLASGTSASHQIVNDVTNMPDDADMICFEGGINDYWVAAPLGSYTESDYSSTLDTTTICGALESIFRQAKVKWVGKPICFVITHKIKSTVYVQNSQGYTWMDVHDKLVGICKKYAIPYYDAFENSGLNAYDNVQNTNFLTSNSSGTPDGCHPNADGYKKYYVPQLLALFNSLMPRE